jgi:hypothetical protein
MSTCCGAGNLFEYSGCNRIDQSRAPSTFKALGELTLPGGTQRCGQHLDQCVQSCVGLSKTFDLRNGMKHGSVMPAVVKAPDPGWCSNRPRSSRGTWQPGG